VSQESAFPRDAVALVESHLREVEDFPAPGVLFRDITPLIADPAAFKVLIDTIADRYRGTIDAVAGLESRGFILAAPLAVDLGVGMLTVRKAGRLPGPVVGVDYDALCDAVKQLEATYRAGWWRAAEREGADFFLREVEALDRLNVPPVRANWRDAGKIVGILRKMPNSTLRRVAPTTNPMALRFMVLFALQSGYRDGLFDNTISIPRLIHTKTSEYRSTYRTSSAA